MHVDLAASDRKGGLAHVPTEITGFGVRYAVRLLADPASHRAPAASAMTATSTLRRPDDWHLHLRDGAQLAAVLPFTAQQFARALVMPNLKPPMTDDRSARGVPRPHPRGAAGGRCASSR